MIDDFEEGLEEDVDEDDDYEEGLEEDVDEDDDDAYEDLEEGAEHLINVDGQEDFEKGDEIIEEDPIPTEGEKHKKICSHCNKTSSKKQYCHSKELNDAIIYSLNNNNSKTVKLSKSIHTMFYRALSKDPRTINQLVIRFRDGNNETVEVNVSCEIYPGDAAFAYNNYDSGIGALLLGILGEPE